MRVAGKKFVRVVDLEQKTCECGVFEVDEVPCGCMLYVAQKTGVSFSDLLHKDQKGSTFKWQYTDLPPFKVPGNEEIAELEDGDCLLPPAAFPVKAGRPSKKRIKGCIEKALAKVKKN